MESYYSLHTHSRYSARDALPTVERMVDRAVELGQPALGLTDHGTIAGIHDLYRASKKAGIKPFPGVEAYVSLMPNEKRPKTYHMGIIAYNNAGWRNLIKLSNWMHVHFKYKPVLSVSALTEMSRNNDLEGLIALTGCHFGVTNTALRNSGFVGAKNVINALQDLFKGDVYVELQHHNIVDENHNELGIELALTTMADELGLPTVITSDSHYLIPDDKRAHETLKRFSSWSDDPDAAIFPGDGYYMCSEEDMRERFQPDTFKNAMFDMDVLLERNEIDIEQLNTFKMMMPDLGLPTSSGAMLKKRTIAALVEKDLMRIEYIDQLREELQLLERLGFNDYLLLTAEVTDHMREEGIVFNARGSASGSIVCWLLGITPIDPLKWGLRFDRFLSGERSKPPDIDLDVEHDRREEVIAWLDDRYSTARIGTWRELKVNDEDKGSLRVKRDQYVRKIGLDPEILSDDERFLMRELSAHKAYDGVGMHPAGVIVAPDSGTVDTIPMEWIASSKSMVTALDKREVEAVGFLKLDMLGLRTLTALKIAEQGGPHHDEIKLVDSAVMRRIKSGKTHGIFQLNGKSAQFGCRKLKPTKFTDLVAAMALFRPGVQTSGATDEYIRRRHGGEWVPLDPMIEGILADTYGMMLYQEQMMTLLRDMGMNADDLNRALKAIKASNAATVEAAIAMDKLTVEVNTLTKQLGWDEASKQWLFEAMAGFVEYSFNKCTIGSTVVRRSTGGQYTGPDITVKELYDNWHSDTPVGQKYRGQRGVKIMSLHSDGRVRPDMVKGVYKQGVQQVWKVTLEGGESVTTTLNHRHLTSNGYMQVSDLVVGDCLVRTSFKTEPQYQKKGTGSGWAKGSTKRATASDGRMRPTTDGEHSKLTRNSELLPPGCAMCHTTEGRMEISHFDSDRSNNSVHNLNRLCSSCHKKLDYAFGSRKKRMSKGYYSTLDEIASIEYAGEEETYDIEMESEEHNYIANGIVTHNSHAVSYARIAFITAWYAVHKPSAFWTGALTVAKSDDVSELLVQAVEHGVVLLPPDVNTSAAGYTAAPELKAVRKGLLSVHGVGVKAANELVDKAPFKSLNDLATRVNARMVTGAKKLREGVQPATCGGVIAALDNEGALNLEFEKEEEKV